MKSRNEEKKRRILARLTARELSLEDLGYVRGGEDDNQDYGSGCGCGGGASTLLVTQPGFTEDN